jgi:hypothetical protein
MASINLQLKLFVLHFTSVLSTSYMFKSNVVTRARFHTTELEPTEAVCCLNFRRLHLSSTKRIRIMTDHAVTNDARCFM